VNRLGVGDQLVLNIAQCPLAETPPLQLYSVVLKETTAKSRAEQCSCFVAGKGNNRETNMSTLPSELQHKQQHSTQEKHGIDNFPNFQVTT